MNVEELQAELVKVKEELEKEHTKSADLETKLKETSESLEKARNLNQDLVTKLTNGLDLTRHKQMNDPVKGLDDSAVAWYNDTKKR